MYLGCSQENITEDSEGSIEVERIQRAFLRGGRKSRDEVELSSQSHK